MTVRSSEPRPAKLLRPEAMSLVPWPSLDQQLELVRWATTALPWAEMFAFDAPGALVVILAEDAGAGREGDAAGIEHRRKHGALDLVRLSEGVWQRMDGRPVELPPSMSERLRCDVGPCFDGAADAPMVVCRRFGPRADRMMQLRLTESQRAALAKVQTLVDQVATHLLDDAQRRTLTEHPDLRSDAPDLEAPVRDYLRSKEALAAEYGALHKRETAKLWAVIHRLGAGLGYSLH